MNLKNCLIFISDALRWDFIPSSLKEEGIVFKTVSASIDTSTSIPSIVTGVQPVKHGVFSFYHTIPDNLKSIFDIENFDIGYYNAAGLADGLNFLLKQESFKELEELNPPFVYFERDHGGHHPYRGTGYDKSLKTFKREFSYSVSKIRKKYSEAVLKSVSRFRKLKKKLKKRDLLEDTLLIFTSDHGELLGEHGIVGHLAPVHPELIYVPTIFINPNISRPGKQKFMSHIDIFPTILRFLDLKVPSQCDGRNIFSEDVNLEKNFPMLNYAIKGFRLGSRIWYYYKASSIWTENGGHVFNESDILQKSFNALELLCGKKWKSTFVRNKPDRYVKALRGYLKDYIKYGKPEISKQAAKTNIERIKESKWEAIEHELEEEVKEKLKELGYF